MTNYAATIDTAGRGGRIGQQVTGSGYYDLGGGISNGDTITFSNLLPKGGAKVVGVQVICPELDTGASPTGKITVGDGTDADGYVETENVGLPAVLPANGKGLNIQGNGALIGTEVTNRDVIITFTAALATSISTGRIRLNAILEGTAA